MARLFVLVSLTLISMSASVSASITVTVDKLDPLDNSPMPPSHLVIADVFVDLSPDDSWGGGAIVGVTETGAGARLVYALDMNGLPVPTAPGTDQRFVTFLSMPRGRNADDRFDVNGAAAIWGGYFGSPSPIFRPTDINVVYGDPPPPAPSTDGYVARIAIDLTNVSDPAFRVDSPNIVAATEQPPNSILLFVSAGPDSGGTYVGAYSNADDGIDWGIYGIIPEPATLGLLVFAMLLLPKRRH